MIKQNKKVIEKFLLLIFVVVFAGCSLAKRDVASSEKRQGLYLSDEDITLYMAYNAAIYGGDINNAQQFIETLVERYPERTDFLSELVGIYIYQKKADKALTLIEKALEKDPANLNILSSLSDVYMLKGDRKSAIATLEKVLSIEKNRENIPIVLANLYYQEKEFEKAKTLLEEFVKAKPDNLLAHLYLAKIYENLGKNTEAAKEYELVLQENDDDQILLALDNLYDKLGEKEKSIEILERFLKRNPDYPKVIERLALLYVSINNYEKALLNYEMLIKKYPENKELKIKYVLIALDGGFYDKAKVPLFQILEEEPDNQKALYFAGLLFKETKDWQKAITYFEKVTDKEYQKSAIIYLSMCYEKLGDNKKAFSVLKDYWDREQDSDIGYYLAVHYKNSKDYEKALDIIKKLLESAENKGKIILLLAELHLKKNEFEKGIEIVKDWLEKNPEDPDALNFIGYSYVEKGINLDLAENFLNKALTLKPDDPYIMDSLAWLHYMKKEYQKALEIQKKVVLKVNDDATIFEHMGDILLAIGDKKEAKFYYNKALENQPENLESIRKKLEELKDN